MKSSKIGAYTFIHNPDMSGSVEIINSSGTSFKIGPARVLIEFVAEIVRARRIAVLERADIFDLLKLSRGNEY